MTAIDVVEAPAFSTCCRAVIGIPFGMMRPRRSDRSLLAGLDVGALPAGTVTVDVTALPQRPRSVPTAAIAEGVRRPRRIDNAMTAFVVRHPAATFLVDPGICRDVVGRAVNELPRVLRVAVTPPSDVLDVSRSLALAGLDVSDVDFALPTHLHWDHVAGLLDLPELALCLHREEHTWAMAGATTPVGGVRRSVRGRPLSLFDLDGPPVLTFDRSHDFFGDGSVVVVDLRGHTPGSIGILLRTRGGPVLLAGDAIWHGVQLDSARQKPSYPGLLADVDRNAAWQTLHRLVKIKDTVSIIATHDHAAAQRLRIAVDDPGPVRIDDRACGGRTS